MNRTYYFIDYRATIDAIKWRVYSIDKSVQGTTVAADERKEFFCSRCKGEYTMMDVLTFRHGPQGFLCQRCGFELKHDLGSNQGGHEQSTKLNAQFKFITDMLPKIDQVVIPENTFEHAFEVAVKVERDETNPAYETKPVDASSNRPTAVKGMANTGPTSISITLTTSDGPSEAELTAERALKEQIASQNAMPHHFTHSTITGEQVKFTGQPTFQTSQSVGVDQKDVEAISVNGDSAEIDDYFARLKAEQAKEAEQEQDEEGDSDDEEDDEDLGFEDVMTGGSGVGTPAISTPGDDGRPSKKIKVEEDEESEEEMEFEDV